MNRRKFKPTDDTRLLKLVKKYAKDPNGWAKISSRMNGFTVRQCKERYTIYLQSENRNDPWTESEDKQLLDLYKEFGPKWKIITSFFNGRNSNNVKNRWYRYIKKNYADEIQQLSSASSPDVEEKTEEKGPENQTMDDYRRLFSIEFLLSH